MTMIIPRTLPGAAPLVEIRGPWLLNKGDALMLQAVVAALDGRFALAAEGGLGRRRLPRASGVERLAWGSVGAARLSRGWMTRSRRAAALRDAAALALPARARAALRLRDGRALAGLVKRPTRRSFERWP